MFQRALLNMCITTCFGLNPSHHQVLHVQQDALTQYKVQYCVHKSTPLNLLLSEINPGHTSTPYVLNFVTKIGKLLFSAGMETCYTMVCGSREIF
jgi:hypothetical protein